MIEQWKALPVDGWGHLYEISNLGRVQALPRTVHKSNGTVRHFDAMPMKNSFNGKYLFVSLRDKDRKQMFQVHRLVALAFIPNPLGKPEVNHKDCYKRNNVVTNLEWTSADENRQHAIRNGRFKRSDEFKRKLSRTNTGRTLTPEHCAKMSIALKGRVFSTEHRRKLSVAGVAVWRRKQCANS